VPVYTVTQQPSALAVIELRAAENNSNLFVVDETDVKSLRHVKLGISGDHQYFNAALAKKLVEQFIKRIDLNCKMEDDYVLKGLANTKWPGRCMNFQSKVFPNTDWCLDGAHTVESLQVYL
jgi:folylpolyglutamate synthase